MTAPTRAVRLGLVLSGGASLGAYHAGAVSALLTARNAVARASALQVDAIGGASAGALVALLGAWAVATGRDPVWLLREAWVERVDLDLLRGGDGRAPLDFDGLRDAFVDLLRTAPHATGAATSGVTVHVSLTGLRGLTYPVRGLRGDDSIRAVTYADWYAHHLDAGSSVEEVAAPEGACVLDAALASAANPGGFAPRLLDRSRDRQAYEQHGIDRLPEPPTLWFSDGGIVQSEPVGRVVAASDPAEDAQRIALLVDPRSEDPEGAGTWSDPHGRPGWVDGLQRALAILPAHEFYEDLRRIERDNARLQWVDRLTEALLDHLDDGARDDLRTVLSQIARDEQRLRPADHEPGREVPAGDDTLRSHLRRALAELAGVTGKGPVDADVISPLLLASDGTGGTADLLAGEILGDFGGFLDRDLRASDFALGYASALAWLRQGLPRTDLPADLVAAAVEAVEQARQVDWVRTNRGDATPRDLGWGARAAAARLALQLLKVTARQVTGVDRVVPDPVHQATAWLRRRLARR